MSIQTKAILIDLTLTAFSTSRTDNAVTQETLLKKNAVSQSAGRWITKLLPKHATEQIAKHDGRIRKFHYTNTLPWSDKGARILPARNFDHYMETMRHLKRDRQDLIETFHRNYQNYLLEAAQTLGGLYNPDHYPTANEAAEQYSIEIKPSPVPSADDFRVSLADNHQLNDIKENLNLQVHQAVKLAEKDLLNRILEPLRNLAEKLANPDTKFKNTLVTNLQDIMTLIPTLNVMDNPDFQRISQLIEDQLSHYTPDTLRNSPADRATAARKADEIATQATAWMA